MDIRDSFNKWIMNVEDPELKQELVSMSDSQIEDAFCCDLVFGTGGLRGIIGAGTNRMNVHVVARASQGLADYLGTGKSVVIGYDSRIKSRAFAKTAAEILAANGIAVWIWPEIIPVPAVSYAIRHLKASHGIMITASHNPAVYNGYKVYGSDGCQITTHIASEIMVTIKKTEYFSGVNRMEFDVAVAEGKVKYIASDVLTAYIEEVKNQSVLFGETVNRNIKIVYSPLNGAGLKPIVRVLKESGFTDLTVVEEQRNPDGKFPTCPYPNPENREAMELGLEYCRKTDADLFLATDPDSDRCGVAVRDGSDYRLLSGNEVGILLLDFICSQRSKYNAMPKTPVFIKTIVTSDLAERIAKNYGVRTINVLTGFKYIGEEIGELYDERDFICGFEESCGYLTGTYVRDKDAVNAAFMVCEMAAYYKSKHSDFVSELNNIYGKYGYCLNTLYSYDLPGSAGMKTMGRIMSVLRGGIKTIGGKPIKGVSDYSTGINGLPRSNVIRFSFSDQEENVSLTVRPSGTEPKLKIYISALAENEEIAKNAENSIRAGIETLIGKEGK